MFSFVFTYLAKYTIKREKGKGLDITHDFVARPTPTSHGNTSTENQHNIKQKIDLNTLPCGWDLAPPARFKDERSLSDKPIPQPGWSPIPQPTDAAFCGPSQHSIQPPSVGQACSHHKRGDDEQPLGFPFRGLQHHQAPKTR